METTIFFITLSLFTSTLCLPVQDTNLQPQENLQNLILLPALTPAEDAAQELEDFNPEDAVEVLDPEEYDVSPEGDETMETAANLVFRPLFSYRKIQEKRKRLYGGKRGSSTTSSPNALRRSQVVVYSQPGRYIYPQNYQSYPYYYRNAPYYYSN